MTDDKKVQLEKWMIQEHLNRYQSRYDEQIPHDGGRTIDSSMHMEPMPEDPVGVLASSSEKDDRITIIADAVSVLMSDNTPESEVLEFSRRIRKAVADRLGIHPVELDSIMSRDPD